jgi:hypothetical protein
MPNKHGNQVKVTLSIDPTLRELAKEYDVNLSLLLELALIRYFYKVHGLLIRTKKFEKYKNDLKKLIELGVISLEDLVRGA